ncbi:MAG: nitroreductase, partial [Bacteroidetes bacterium HGW-Bacteroidetes-15]
YRYICMEAGHVAQNIHLQAVALGLGSVPVGAFDDDKIGEILGCKENEVPLYIIPVGFEAEE